MRWAAICTAGFLIFGGGAEGAEVDVPLRGGAAVSMKEPVDMMGLTWGKTRDSLPPVFLLVDEGAASEGEKLTQLLNTARSLGHLYVTRYEVAAGGAEDGADLLKVEAKLAKIQRGEGNPEDLEAVKQGEAVIFWSAMLEDKAAELGVKAPTSPTPNASAAFLDAYAGGLERDGERGIYEEAIKMVAKDNPAAIASYLSRTTPERRKLIEGLAGSAVPN